MKQLITLKLTQPFNNIINYIGLFWFQLSYNTKYYLPQSMIFNLRYRMLRPGRNLPNSDKDYEKQPDKTSN